MYRTIIVGHDLHDGGEDALALGRLVRASTDSELIVAAVALIGTDPRRSVSGRFEHEQDVAARLQVIAREVGAEPKALTGPSLADGLRQLARERDAPVIVVGTSCRGQMGQILAGEPGLRLARGSPCVVAIAPRGYSDNAPGAVERVVVGFDGSYESGLALLSAVGVAKATGAGVELVAVAVAPRLYRRMGATHPRSELVEQLQGALDEAVGSISDDVSAEGTLLRGDPAHRLREAASGGGVLMIGSRAYGRFRRVLLGSVSSRLVGSVPCPVFLHPHTLPSGPGRRSRFSPRSRAW